MPLHPSLHLPTRLDSLVSRCSSGWRAKGICRDLVLDFRECACRRPRRQGRQVSHRDVSARMLSRADLPGRMNVTSPFGPYCVSYPICSSQRGHDSGPVCVRSGSGSASHSDLPNSNPRLMNDLSCRHSRWYSKSSPRLTRTPFALSPIGCAVSLYVFFSGPELRRARAPSRGRTGRAESGPGRTSWNSPQRQ